jgi:hypothetical protein
MLKAVIMAFALMALIACGDAPQTSPALEQSFSIVSQHSDPATSSATIIITVAKDATQPQVKAAAEAVIASRKGKYKQITVKSFLEGASLDGTPLAVSTLRGNSVDHVFDAVQGGSTRIPTH